MPTVPCPPVSHHWSALDDDALLDVRFCELGLDLKNSWLAPRLATLDEELAAQGFLFRPHFWLSAEWFSPDGVPGVAIPFYLAHPRLMQLERRQMFDVEGGDHEWCMEILRHEVGHAIDNAYQLRRRRRRVQLFGRPSTPYPESYAPKPYSREFVLHLDGWYAQSHPDEDFAETFAVWLTPGGGWRERYRGWPALRKLEYIDTLMRRIAPTPAPVTTRRTVDRLGRLRSTLRRHYARQKVRLGLEFPRLSDRDLRRLFSDRAAHRTNPKASRLMHRTRRHVRRLVAEWTGLYQYTIDRIIGDMIDRCDALDLRLRDPDDRATLDFIMLITVHTVKHLHTGRHRMVL
jgi:hypothetical protein